MLQKETLELIAEYIIMLEKIKDLNKYIYDNTELFEESRTSDYRMNLFRLFAGKLNTYSREINKIYQLLAQKEKIEVNKYKILRK